MTESPSITTTFDCPAGTVMGWTDGPVVRATGIRYAHAERFEVPTPQPPATEPIDATSWSPACPQRDEDGIVHNTFGDAALGDLVPDEHAQYLSVTIPADRGADEVLPVMVWIHGGSYIIGAADAPCHDPGPLVAEQRVVVVSVTYRLGLFGFLGDGVNRPANLGLLDMIEALRWVRTNIAGFGGDPDTVTVFGESAGGDAIAQLMAAEATSGLFHRAILQSAPLGITRRRERMHADMFAASHEVSASASVDEVLSVQESMMGPGALLRHGLPALMSFGPQYGHHPLPSEDEVDAAWAARASEVEILIGWNSRETGFFTHAIGGVSSLPRLPIVGNLVHETLVHQLTKAVYTKAADRFARRHRKAGGEAAQYVIEWGVPGNPLRAVHTVDIPLLFGTPETWAGAPILAGHDAERATTDGRELRRIWADFARDGWTSPADVPGLIRFG
ncbi:carboxylesterase family protein [Gordonia soli]|uniref:Carboxylic ester hydrolase n=1 Tax=Gordonia soli NBRC 108243 TaxID=1223545 RepID=M0QEX3_9ACTN|nr:carboxylesterase family protein [Gordonia soli]GAC66846.1 putative carboxylesterase [Gordonia soli NBRC 108243]